MDSFKKHFGQNLKVIRKSRKITQEKLAELVDLHPQQISKIETGSYFPSCRTLEKFCITLSVSPRNLFNFELFNENELVMTGTDAAPCFRAVKSGSLIELFDLNPNSKEKIMDKFSANDQHASMIKLALKLNKPVTVQYIDENNESKLQTYYPDGTTKSADSSEVNDYEKDLKFMMDKFKEIVKSAQRANFVKLAIEALDNDEALNKLDFLIDGMKLARVR